MSNTPSPYSQPFQMDPPQSGSSRNMVMIIAIISGTVLLLCGGIIGLGFYAVNQWTEQMTEFSGDFDEEETTTALEFAIAQDPEILKRVGEIENVEARNDLTYHMDAGEEDYFYRVSGSSGDALIVVEFDYRENRWFQSVSLVDGEEIGDPKITLSARHAPFDSKWSKRVYDVLVAKDNALANSLEIGAIDWITYDYEASSPAEGNNALRFEIHGETGDLSIVAQFEDVKYTHIRAIRVVDDDGTEGETIFNIDDVTESEPTAAETP